MRTFPLDNYYAHPVEGLHALIDLSNLEVLRVEDHFAEKGDYIPVPRTPLNFDAEVLTKFRPPSAPLDVVQPEGPGFRWTVTGSPGKIGISGSDSTAARAWCSTLSATRSWPPASGGLSRLHR